MEAEKMTVFLVVRVSQFLESRGSVTQIVKAFAHNTKAQELAAELNSNKALLDVSKVLGCSFTHTVIPMEVYE